MVHPNTYFPNEKVMEEGFSPKQLEMFIGEKAKHQDLAAIWKQLNSDITETVNITKHWGNDEYENHLF